MPYLPYEEPGIITILSLSSFLLLLNVTRHIVDHYLYCGIIAEILIGIIWGLPVGGTAWLSLGTQQAIQSFGYLGLIALVFEGGLSTDLSLLRKSVYLSACVATIGLLTPVALSFLLLLLPFPSEEGNVYPTPLAAFSAGASLCSTSLGTTFAILSSAGMQHTRIGVVLVGAAMMDDVVGLVMVQIVTTLGSGSASGSAKAWPIARPIVASFGLFLVTIGITPWLLKPLWLRMRVARWVQNVKNIGFVVATSVLIGYVTIASFVDGSVLFSAFIAGGLVNHLWRVQEADGVAGDADEVSTPAKMYESYFKPLSEYVLIPFFFASIGFSIPITSLFTASVIWRGFLYSILMIVGKLATSSVCYFEHFTYTAPLKTHMFRQKATRPESEPVQAVASKPPHLIALLLGAAMCARGEIGFLIASLSQSSGTLSLKSRDQAGVVISDGDQVFLVLIWAVVLCTILGPISVGLVVRKLNGEAREQYLRWL